MCRAQVAIGGNLTLVASLMQIFSSTFQCVALSPVHSKKLNRVVEPHFGIPTVLEVEGVDDSRNSNWGLPLELS